MIKINKFFENIENKEKGKEKEKKEEEEENSHFLIVFYSLCPVANVLAALVLLILVTFFIITCVAYIISKIFMYIT